MEDRFYIIEPVASLKSPLGEVAVLDSDRGMIVSYCSKAEGEELVRRLNNGEEVEGFRP